MIKNFATLVFVLVITHAAMGQDINFSQFYNAPLSLNPALAGSMDKNYRINGNHRTQWSQALRGDAYIAYNVSADRKITLKNGDALGIGLNGFADRAGELSYGSTQGLLSFAYHKNLGNDTIAKHTISFAAEYGIVERKVDLTNARWPSQHDGNGGFCDTCQIEIIGFNSSFIYPDISLGLNWKSKLSETFSFSIGGAIRHINQPNISFYGDQSNESLNQRYTIHAEAEWQMGKVVSLAPRLLYLKQGSYTQITPGLELGFGLDKLTLYLGQYLRTHKTDVINLISDAHITSFNMVFNVFRFGISYDAFNTSMIRHSGGSNGAIELTTAVVF